MRSFYLPEGEGFRATELTRGPWNNDHQHGGPPAALLGRAVEQLGAHADEFFVSRLLFELVRPVPVSGLIEPLLRFTREGRQAQRIEGVLNVGGVEVMKVTALRLKRQALALPQATSRPPEAPLPGVSRPSSSHSFNTPWATTGPSISASPGAPGATGTSPYGPGPPSPCSRASPCLRSGMS